MSSKRVLLLGMAVAAAPAIHFLGSPEGFDPYAETGYVFYAPGACQNQACVWNDPDGCYQCQSAEDFACRPDSCTSCTESRCS